jgi:exodeoxyribonuclease V alpha subunit
MVSHQSEPIELAVRVEHITFYDETSGFTILQAKTQDDAAVTVVGDLMSPVPGTILEMEGRWETHQHFGRQFRATRARAQAPTSLEGIEKYLASGLVKGVGKEMAGRMVRHFGKQTLAVIGSAPERLIEVDGIGPKRAALIQQAWREQKSIRDVMLFLQSHGVSTAYATKIFRRYGQQTIGMVQRNPYRLAEDIFGIGFLKADGIALSLGFGPGAPKRMQAGVLHTLKQVAQEGHLYYPYEPLIDMAASILKAERQPVADAIDTLASVGRLVVEPLGPGEEVSAGERKAVYLAHYHQCETFTAQRLRQLLDAPASGRPLNTDKAVQWMQHRFELELARDQHRAVVTALENKVMVITGGPGTGKTTIIQAIFRIYERNRSVVLLAAPTGRAAKRLSEATGRPAKTIHRLLKYNPHQGGFAHHADNPLDVDLLVLDESSMIDAELMVHLLAALPQTCGLILVGDISQLPSVGPGNLLKDILASGAVPHVTLRRIFRQARQSQIITNAHRINAGQMPLAPREASTQAASDFYFIQQQDPNTILSTILTLVRERIPARFGLDPLDDIQVLTPMHRGIIGAQNLNSTLQKALNPQEAIVTRGEQHFGPNDKVMQIRNNYEKDVYNGDIGRIEHIEPGPKTVTIRFDGRRVNYDFDELNEVVLAYAVTVHKSQGSEYPAVVIPITTQHYILLQRNLIYTAVTRARRLVVLVGTRQALAMAVKNDRPLKRYTRLAYRMGLHVNE